MQNRESLRQHLRQQRRSLTTQQQSLHSHQALQHIINHPLFLQSQHIAFYLATDGELDIKPILDIAQQQKKMCYLPVLHPKKHNELLFMPYSVGQLVKNRFGILEPVLIPEQLISPCSLDLIFIPLVAVDNQGNRIGRGAGYYDRSFSFLKNTASTIKLIGAAHEFQIIEQVEAQEWDVPVDGILTECNFTLID